MSAQRHLGGALVLALAAVTSFWGLLARDLTGDEISTLGSSFLSILDNAYAVHRPEEFSARLPLFSLLRRISLALFGADSVLGWRLPAALGAIAGSWLTWWALHRRGRPTEALIVGLLLAANPLLSFQAHDASNYALAPLCTALVLAGLADLRDGGPRAVGLLAGGLLLGAFNDYFFAFVAASALGVTLLHVREVGAGRAAAARAWAIVLGVQSVPALLLLWRATRGASGALLTKHADAADAIGGSLFHTLSGYVIVFLSTSFQGYMPDHEEDRWLLAAAAALLLAGLARALRGGDSLDRSAAWVVIGSLGQAFVAGLVFAAITGRAAPLAGRAHMALLPALVIVWGCAIAPWRRRPLGALPGVLLVAVALGGTASQLAHIADTRARVARELEGRWRPGDVVVSMVGLGFRLAPRIPHHVEPTRCLPASAGLPDRLWVLGDPGGTDPQTVGICDGGPALMTLDPPYRLSFVRTLPVPRYETGSGSFLIGSILFLYERGAATVGPVPRVVTATATLARAARGGEARLEWSGDVIAEEAVPFAPPIDLGPPRSERLSVAVFPRPLGPIDTSRALAVWALPLSAPGVGPATWSEDGPTLELGRLPEEGPVTRGIRRLLAVLVALWALLGAAVTWRRR